MAPRAQLYAQNGKLTGSHFVGPTWVAMDGSYVVGRRVNGVNVDPTAIDWLLLEKDTSAAGADGDRLTATTYIQRINTTGGRAPAASECDETGETAEIPYAADYYFWKAHRELVRVRRDREPSRRDEVGAALVVEDLVDDLAGTVALGACSIRPRAATKPTW